MRQEFTSDVVQLATRIPKSLHTQIRVNALDSGVTLSEWVSDALAAHLESGKRGGQKPAGKRAKRAEGAPKDAA